MFDPNMNDAWELAEKMGPPPEIPPTLDNKERRTRFALELDSTFAGILIRKLSESQKSLWLQKVDEGASKFTSERGADNESTSRCVYGRGCSQGPRSSTLKTGPGLSRQSTGDRLQQKSRSNRVAIRFSVRVVRSPRDLRS